MGFFYVVLIGPDVTGREWGLRHPEEPVEPVKAASCYRVFADSDAVKSVSVMEGDSVTLQTNTELQTEDLMTWTFGHLDTRIAQIIKETGIFSTYDVLDGRFRDRLKLDHQTGSLTITNTRTTDSGLYQATIIMTDTTYRFNVTVSAMCFLFPHVFLLLIPLFNVF
ncbi:CD48 antigen [Labeo rohita]|uniref:CD48 antigen n=1 Tax=Labeo rohita TaxID=84645 RepID=A0ABQ8L2N8_LABRO|nr:CD48 antigen [Labeo rohita]